MTSIDIKKKVGNACRTKGQIRHSKASGSAFEYDCLESLRQTEQHERAYLTKQQGFQLQYDIQCDETHTVFECKRLKGISWNQLVAIRNKLQSVAPKGYFGYVLFKSNHQPCLVFDGYSIMLFHHVFDLPFIKHKPVVRGKNDETNQDNNN